jgi:hypothetical protein
MAIVRLYIIMCFRLLVRGENLQGDLSGSGWGVCFPAKASRVYYREIASGVEGWEKCMPSGCPGCSEYFFLCRSKEEKLEEQYRQSNTPPQMQMS